MEIGDIFSWALVLVFVVGYVLIVLEHAIHINKATSALLMGVIAWILQFANESISHHENVHYFGEHLSNVAQVVIFLMGVLTIVEVINTHDGFRIIRNLLTERSKKKMLWIVGITTFVLSAVLGSITTTVVMIALLAKVIPLYEDRLILGSGIVIAANAGGAFSPVGDITTTMLWIGGQLSTSRMMLDLSLPSLVCMSVGLLFLQLYLKGELPPIDKPKKPERISNIIFFLGIGSILFVPLFKGLTGLPPFMGVLLGLSIIWLVTDLIHVPEERHHLTLPNIIGKLDFTIPIFFLGILLAINAMETAGILKATADYISSIVSSPLWIAGGIGIVSAVIDNVPLVAAVMGMYSLETFAQDHPFWQLVAYSAGVGGSILIFGSAPGVAFMGLEKVRFGWYFKKASLPALLAFIAGLLVFVAQSQFFS
jgi:Na+/H+ antiporter NhaD/arsenite permease-like protein